ncbi:MAG: hypothetical protein AAF664_07595 [Planctomycetota bacterium]
MKALALIGQIRSGDEYLVGGLAVVAGLAAFVIAIGPWSGPYRLRTVARIDSHYGRFAARLLWAGLGIVSLASGLAILSGLRPSYAIRSKAVSMRQRIADSWAIGTDRSNV